jgi:pimeloyl-ACP methyl ester carboxylesterase
LQDYMDDLAGFLRYVIGEPAVLYGHSLGGEVAVMVAAEHPDLVRALIVGDVPLSLGKGYPTEDPALHLLPHGAHVRLEAVGHELHGPPGQELLVLQAITPFLEALQATCIPWCRQAAGAPLNRATTTSRMRLTSSTLRITRREA